MSDSEAGKQSKHRLEIENRDSSNIKVRSRKRDRSEYRSLWGIANRDKERANSKKYREANKDKRLAQRMVGYRVAKGLIARQTCEVCGEPDAHAHHDDYSKPLEIRWFCQLHHNQYHAAKRCGYEYPWMKPKDTEPAIEASSL